MATTAAKSKSTPKRQTKRSAAQRAVEAKEADARRAAAPRGSRIRARLGETGARSALLALQIGLGIATSLVILFIVMFVAVTVVPYLFVMVASGTGVGPEATLQMQLAHWLAPSLFLTGLSFILVCVVVRSLWRARVRLSGKARHALLGEEDQPGRGAESVDH